MPTIKHIYTMKNEEDTKNFAIKLAASAEAGDVLALIGDLGTGKTALTKYLAKALGVTEHITSPTFTIVKEYESGRIPLYHFDVYRIGNSEEMFEIGVDDYLFGKGICVIEWADIIEDILPDDTKFIYLEYGQGPEERVYKCTF